MVPVVVASRHATVLAHKKCLCIQQNRSSSQSWKFLLHNQASKKWEYLHVWGKLVILVGGDLPLLVAVSSVRGK